MFSRVFKLALFVLIIFSANAYSDEKPFEELLKQTEKTSWNLNHRILLDMFNKERTRLGDNFIKEVFIMIEKNPERHYIVANFLEEPGEGHSPMHEVALLILNQGILICKQHMDDVDIRMQLVSIYFNATLLSKKLGLMAQASLYKREYSSLIEKEPILKGAIPLCGPEKRNLFDLIEDYK